MLCDAYDRRVIENRHYRKGTCIALLKIHGAMTAIRLAELSGIDPRGIGNLLMQCKEIKKTRKPHSWFYEKTGNRRNKRATRDIAFFSLVEA